MSQASEQSLSPSQHASDSRLKYLDREMARHSYNRSGLVEVLFKANGLFGHLSKDILRYIARSLNIAPSRVYAAATFYSRFNLHPNQDSHLRMCSGLSCHMNGSNLLAEELAGPDEVMEGVPCAGLCGHGPVVHVGSRTVVKATAAAVQAALKDPEGDGA